MEKAIHKIQSSSSLNRLMNELWVDIDTKNFTIKDEDVLLYHYTNLPAAFAILSSRSIYASDVRYLNDSREINYGNAIFGQAVRKLKKESKGNRIKTKLIDIIEDYYGADLPPSYAACFCLDGDLLSQWRAYGGDAGVAIGFDGQVLNDSEFNLSKVIYDPSQQYAIVKSMLEQAIDLGRRAYSSLTYADLEDAIGGTTGPMSSFIVPLKDPAFREEQEYRLYLSYYELSESVKIDYRSTKNFIVGYTRVCFSAIKWKKAIRTITVGPGSFAELRAKNLKELLKDLGLGKVKVETSKAPYRA